MGNQCQTGCKKSTLDGDDELVLLKTESQALKYSVKESVYTLIKCHCISPIKPYGLEYYPESKIETQEEPNFDLQSSVFQSTQKIETQVPRMNHAHLLIQISDHQKQFDQLLQQQQTEIISLRHFNNRSMHGSMTGVKLISSDRQQRDRQHQERKLLATKSMIQQTPPKIPRKSSKSSQPSPKVSPRRGSQQQDTQSAQRNSPYQERRGHRSNTSKSKSIILNEKQHQTHQKHNYNTISSYPQKFNTNTYDLQDNVLHQNQYDDNPSSYIRSASYKIRQPSGILKSRSPVRKDSFASEASGGYGTIGKRQVRFKDQQRKK